MTELICSAKGCSAVAAHEILWNNPKIHQPERRKSWLACATHLVDLRNFLAARNFYKETKDLS